METRLRKEGEEVLETKERSFLDKIITRNKESL